jgi:3-isopropylmalate dehydrogenase
VSPGRIALAAIPGDGIGPEVVAQACLVLDAVAKRFDFSVETTKYDVGADRYLRTGEVLAGSVLQELRGHDALLLGAVGDPRVPSGVLERGLLLRLRFELDLAVNLRPVRLFPGVRSPLGLADGDVDMVFVREGTEGSYVGGGVVLRPGTSQEVALEESLNTRHGVERAVRYAFGLADRRPRRRLTWVHKTNVLVHAGGLWERVVAELGNEFPEVAVDYLHVDAACLHLVERPARFDVVVTDNLFGDILTDLAAAVGGGIGLAASANLNLEGTAPSMFEPVHGSAPDLAGRGVADPTACVLSLGLLLDHLGQPEAAAAVEQAVAADLAGRAGRPPRSTAAIGAALAAGAA